MGTSAAVSTVLRSSGAGNDIGTIPPETAATPASAPFVMAIMGAVNQSALTCVISPTVVMVALF